MSPSILVAQNLSKVVPSAEGDLTILHALSLDLAQGDSLAIVGASGSGKSTLLGLLAGLDRPSAGKVIQNISMSPAETALTTACTLLVAPSFTRTLLT